MHFWAGRIKLFLSGEACELVAGWICVRWSVSVLSMLRLDSKQHWLEHSTIGSHLRLRRVWVMPSILGDRIKRRCGTNLQFVKLGNWPTVKKTIVGI